MFFLLEREFRAPKIYVVAIPEVCLRSVLPLVSDTSLADDLVGRGLERKLLLDTAAVAFHRHETVEWVCVHR
jgi:hypothetical protein